MISEAEEIWLEGKPICRGIAIGPPFFFQQAENAVQEYRISDEEDIEEEVDRYYQAVQKSKEEILHLQKRLQREQIYDGATILDAHLVMMEDPLLTTYIEEQIRDTRKNAESVFEATIDECQKKFNTIADPFFRERFKDIRDISARVAGHLKNSVRLQIADMPPGSILFTLDLTAFDSAEAESDAVAAFVTTEGGATSHAAIVAKAKGIPYVSGIPFDQLADSKESLIIVDGRTGQIILNPTEKTLAKYRQLQEQLKSHIQKIHYTGDLEAETFDGHRIGLSANIERFAELEMVHQHGGNGVGLLRTESFFLPRGVLPSEQEQYQAYYQFVQQMRGLKTVIRTFDLGGTSRFPHIISKESLTLFWAAGRSAFFCASGRFSRRSCAPFCALAWWVM